MADEPQHKPDDDNPGRLRRIVSALAMTSVLTFLSGFLQDTPLNFFNYIFIFLLLIGGIYLMNEILTSGVTGTTRGFLFLTGISATLLFIFYIGYEWFRLSGRKDAEASIEALLNCISLFFLVGVAGSLLLIRRLRGIDSSQS